MFFFSRKIHIYQVRSITTSKRIKLESPGGQVWSGFEFAIKPDQPGLSSSIRLEVMWVQT